MKIAMFAVGSMGDIMPFIRLGKHLRANGHAVMFYGESRFARFVECHELSFAGAIDVKIDMDRVFTEGIANVLLEANVLREMAERIEMSFTGADIIFCHPMVTGFHPLAREKMAIYFHVHGASVHAVGLQSAV
jgi:hypothetical protein